MPIAELDNASPSEGEDCGFESRWARQAFIQRINILTLISESNQITKPIFAYILTKVLHQTICTANSEEMIKHFVHFPAFAILGIQHDC